MGPDITPTARIRKDVTTVIAESVRPPLDESILKLSCPRQVAACETPADFLKLFSLYGISDASWRNSKSLRKGLYSAIIADPRFLEKGWRDGFLPFMGLAKKETIDEAILGLPCTRQIAACETPEDFRALFILHGIKEEHWRNFNWMKLNEHAGLCRAIQRDPRFSKANEGDGFLAFMDGTDYVAIEERIETLGLADAVALLADRPSKLRVYLSVSHPDLLEEEVDRLVTHAFKRLHNRRRFDYSDFRQELGRCELRKGIPRRTHEAALQIAGSATGADSVLVEGGATTQRLRVGADGTFCGRISLTVGERNDLRLTSLNHGSRQSGEPTDIAVYQTGTPDDIDALVTLLGEMGRNVLDGIRSDPGRMEYVVRQAEQVLIRKFSGTFAAGEAYTQELITGTQSPVVRKVLKTVLSRFKRINQTTYPNVRENSPLYFFQKYCVAEIQRRMAEGERGVVLANDPGLGKTRTALVAVNGDPATIVTPNSVVSTWSEEATKALKHADVLTLQNVPYARRLELLQTSSASHTVTNVEYLRAKEGDERYGLLSDEETIVVQDEAHGLLNLGSEQSKGARRLQGKFYLFLSATPCKNPKTLRRMLHNLEPDDPRFQSDAAFGKAFPANDPQALRTLSIMKQRYMIRFTKEDVLEEMDPDIPLECQRHRLPRKEHVPAERMGSYTLSEPQCQGIYELLLNWPKWCEKYDKYVPRDEIAKLDALRGNQFALAKTHALRQIANNPNYVGAEGVEDPKAKELLRCVQDFLAEGRKVVIFCQYNAQAEKYAALLQPYQPSAYTGLVSNQGLKATGEGAPILYRADEAGGWVLNEQGLPLEDPEGKPMLALDYERIAFQNSPERRLMISTYAAGAVGVTFTAGKATIFDDLPRDCVEEIQAEDRTHRIDHEHQTHTSVRYARMVGRYPATFLERMKQVWVREEEDGCYTEIKDQRIAARESLLTAYEAFFAQGTFDEVRLANLQTQRKSFRLINDGVADAEELPPIRDFTLAV